MPPADETGAVPGDGERLTSDELIDIAACVGGNGCSDVSCDKHKYWNDLARKCGRLADAPAPASSAGLEEFSWRELNVISMILNESVLVDSMLKAITPEEFIDLRLRVIRVRDRILSELSQAPAGASGEARAAAFDEAAKIADSHAGIEPDYSAAEHERFSCAEMIAAALRDKAEEARKR